MFTRVVQLTADKTVRRNGLTTSFYDGGVGGAKTGVLISVRELVPSWHRMRAGLIIVCDRNPALWIARRQLRRLARADDA